MKKERKKTHEKMEKFIEHLEEYGMGYVMTLDEMPYNQLRLSFWYLGSDYHENGVCATANTENGYWEAMDRILDMSLDYFESEKDKLKIN